MVKLPSLLEEKYKNLKYEESWHRTNPSLFNFVWNSELLDRGAFLKIAKNGLSDNFESDNFSQYDALELKCLLSLEEEIIVSESCSLQSHRKHIFFDSQKSPDRATLNLVTKDDSYFWFTGQVSKDTELFFDLNFEQSNFCVFKFDVHERAKLNLCCLYVGKKGARRFNFYFNLIGQEAEVIFTLVGINGGVVFQDIKSVQTHHVGGAKSDTLFKSLTANSSSCSFWGLIDINSGALKSDAYQLARTMILNDSAKATLIPNLRIKANDVRCTHGASYSKISPNDVFYCSSRGISVSETHKLLTLGFLAEAGSRLNNFQQDFDESLDKKLWGLEF